MAFTDEQLRGVLPDLLRFCKFATRNSDTAEDLFQSTLEKAWRRRDSFEEGTALKSWLFKIARHHLIDENRKIKRVITDSYEDLTARKQMPIIVTLANQEDNIDLQKLFSAVNSTLKPSRRELFIKIAIEGRSYDDVAEEFELPIGTLKTEINRGRKQLHDFNPHHAVELNPS